MITDDLARSFCANLGWLYTHLVAAYSGRLDAFTRVASDDTLSSEAAIVAQAHRTSDAPEASVTEMTSMVLPAQVTSSAHAFMAM